MDYETPLSVPGPTDTKKDVEEKKTTQAREQAYFERNLRANLLGERGSEGKDGR